MYWKELSARFCLDSALLSRDMIREAYVTAFRSSIIGYMILLHYLDIGNVRLTNLWVEFTDKSAIIAHLRCKRIDDVDATRERRRTRRDR